MEKLKTNKDLQEMPVIYEVNGQEVKLSGNIVKNYLTRGNDDVTNQEVVMFINLCKYQKLNPFLNEAYLVKFKGSPAQLITSKEAYLKRAYENPKFEGMKAGIIVMRDKQTIDLEGSFCLPGDDLMGGWAEVYVQDKKYPYVARINFDEFSKGQSTWKTMPKTMIRKTALVQALREAFPDKLGALYTEEESAAITTNPVDIASQEVKQEDESTERMIIDADIKEVSGKQKNILETEEIGDGAPF